MCTIYKGIISEEENFEICIIKNKGKWVKTPFLEVLKYRPELHKEDEEYLWDNDEYLLELYKKLKGGRKKSEHYKMLKKFCKDHSLDFKKIKEELLQLLKKAKKEKFFQ